LVNHETNELFFDDLEIPADNLVGMEGSGFKYILDGLNAERALIAAECIGDGYWFIDKATKYANERVVFDRSIGKNQGVQFPIARAYVNVEAASLMRFRACALFDAQRPCGAEANMAKLLAADASWEAANVCLQTHGGYGFACEYDVERKFRETRLYQVAPISTNLILSYLPNTCSVFRGPSEQAAAGLAGSDAGAGGRRTLLLLSSGGCRSEGDQGGAAEGDFARFYDRSVGELSSYFIWLNRGKQSLVADIQTPRGHHAAACDSERTRGCGHAAAPERGARAPRPSRSDDPSACSRIACSSVVSPGCLMSATRLCLPR